VVLREIAFAARSTIGPESHRTSIRSAYLLLAGDLHTQGELRILTDAFMADRVSSGRNATTDSRRCVRPAS